MQPVDIIGLEVGYRLVPLVDKAQGGDLLARIRGVRRKLTQDLGFLVQTVHIRDNLDLAPNSYRINLAGVPVGDGVIYPERELAINPGKVFGRLTGIETRDPAFGMEAVWIEPSMRDHAQTLGYTVVDASTVIATHLSNVIQTHAHELLGHEEVQHLLNTLAKTAPKLVEDLTPRLLPLGTVVRTLQGLLAERVPIRNMRTIVETLAEHAARTQDPLQLQSQVRVALGRQIVQDIAGMSTELPVITLEPDLEQLLSNSLAGSNARDAGPRAGPGRTHAASSCRSGAAPGTDGRARRAAGAAAAAPDAGALHAHHRAEHACAGLERNSRQPQGAPGHRRRSLRRRVIVKI